MATRFDPTDARGDIKNFSFTAAGPKGWISVLYELSEERYARAKEFGEEDERAESDAATRLRSPVKLLSPASEAKGLPRRNDVPRPGGHGSRRNQFVGSEGQRRRL
jgi:hypothetical protein